eukprot:1245195-Amphidinium_carterae.2
MLPARVMFRCDRTLGKARPPSNCKPKLSGLAYTVPKASTSPASGQRLTGGDAPRKKTSRVDQDVLFCLPSDVISLKDK